MRLISVVTPCFNEEGNAEELHARIRQVLVPWIERQKAERGEEWDYEHLFIDNASRDETPALLRKLAASDSRVRVIFNNRNFGHIRSPFHGLMQGRGEVVIVLASDLQDPPELIPEFLDKWREGWKIVVGQKSKSEETPLFFAARKAYYRLVNRLAEVELLENVTGFGLYDRQVIEAMRSLKDPYPYVRGLISELGFATARVVYTQPTRKRGVSKNNFYTLYDIAMLGITSHSKVPLRLATMMGFAMSLLCFVTGLGYLLYKLLFWSRFDAGVAPLVIGLFFIGSVQLFFIGIVGEYVGFIHTHVLQRPHVTERERLGFGSDEPVQVLAGPDDRKHERLQSQPALPDALEPRVERACFEPSSGLLALELAGGARLSFPARALPALATASHEQIAAVTVCSGGRSLLWDQLDARATTISLLQIAFSQHALAAGTSTEESSQAAQAV